MRAGAADRAHHAPPALHDPARHGGLDGQLRDPAEHLPELDLRPAGAVGAELRAGERAEPDLAVQQQPLAVRRQRAGRAVECRGDGRVQRGLRRAAHRRAADLPQELHRLHDVPDLRARGPVRSGRLKGRSSLRRSQTLLRNVLSLTGRARGSA